MCFHLMSFDRLISNDVKRLSFCLLEEGDEDDDPEYNFLEDLDEPDLEDYRNDRAVRITSGCNLSSV